MANKYYISNGIKMIGTIGNNKGYAQITGSSDLAKRFKYNEGLSFINRELDGSTEWCVQKISNASSGRKYIITTATNFVGDNSQISNNFCYAKPFRNPAEAEAYIKNHREVVKSFGKPYIINEKFEEYEQSECKTFTDDQLEVIGIKRKAPRRILSTAAKNEIYDKAKHYCSICGKPLSYKDMTVDHIVPLSRGGTNEKSNLRCVCGMCNTLKDNRLDHEMYYGMANICSIKAYQDPENELWDRIIRAKVRGTIALYKAGTDRLDTN